MYIFGYFFQKGHFKGLSKKMTHQQKLGGGGANDSFAPPPAPEVLAQVTILLVLFEEVT